MSSEAVRDRPAETVRVDMVSDMGTPSMTPSDSSIQSAATQLAIMADSIGQYRVRVADLAQPFVGTTRDDLVTAIHEAERQLRNAERGLTRAARIAR
jgi:cob(I)alamin adenosyltransferase